MEHKNLVCNRGEEGCLEWFLRRNFGLKGQYYSEAFDALLKQAEAADTQEEVDKILDKWFEDPDWEFAKNYTKEAWDAWDRALEMVDDLVTMGLLDEETAWNIRHGFCDNS